MQHAVPFFKRFDIIAYHGRSCTAPRTVCTRRCAQPKKQALSLSSAQPVWRRTLRALLRGDEPPCDRRSLASGALDGLDVLLSTVQMLAGIPVATVGVGKAGAQRFYPVAV